MEQPVIPRLNLDAQGAPPLLPQAKQAMLEAMEEGGNPSSRHQAGRRAKVRLTRARSQVAALIDAQPDEVYFTSCGTEANAWAIRGLANAHRSRGRHIILTAIEHPSVSATVRRLESEGTDITFLPVNGEGLVSPGVLKAALRPDTVLVSVMLANGEIGTVQPLKDLVAVAKEHGALFHTDAVAAAGYLPINVRDLGIDALSLASDQLFGPPGAGALFVRANLRILPLLEGGGQEQGARSGTEPLIAAAGFGAAAEVARADLPERRVQLAELRDLLRAGLSGSIDRIRFNGPRDQRLPNNLHFCVQGVSSESLTLGLDQEGVNVGIGSACNAKAMRPSHVLKAIGLTEAEAAGALVLSLQPGTTRETVERALQIIPDVVTQLRRVTALTARSS